MQNAFVESFTGRFRDEFLNSHWFLDLGDARRKIRAWIRDYNPGEAAATLYEIVQDAMVAGDGYSRLGRFEFFERP